MVGKGSRESGVGSRASGSHPSTVEDSYVKALRIRSDNGREVKLLEPDDIRFVCVASCISFGLALLESRDGRRALKLNGEDIIREVLRRNRDARVGDAARIQEHVADFLRSVRSNFPCVVVRDLFRQNARTTKGSWDQPPERAFVAQHAAVIEFNAFLVTRLVEYLEAWQDKPKSESRKQRFQTLLFRLGVTMSHELVHVFTSYLLYDRRAHTPPRVGYGPFSTGRAGESGRMWEYRVFGGYMTFRADENFDYVGVVKESGRVKVLTLPAIQFMLRRDFRSSWPFVDEEDCAAQERPVTMDKLKWVTKFGDVFAPLGRDDGRVAPEYDMEFINALMKRGGMCHHVNDVDCKVLAFDPKRRITIWSLSMLAA